MQICFMTPCTWDMPSERMILLDAQLLEMPGPRDCSQAQLGPVSLSHSCRDQGRGLVSFWTDEREERRLMLGEGGHRASSSRQLRLNRSNWRKLLMKWQDGGCVSLDKPFRCSGLSPQAKIKSEQGRDQLNTRKSFWTSGVGFFKTSVIGRAA